MNPYAKVALLAVAIGGLGEARSGVPMDSFNSANAALIPSIATERQSTAAQSSRGPADALVRMALGDRKASELPPEESPPAQLTEPVTP